MRDSSPDHRWLSINTATVRKQRGQDWPLLPILDACATRGIRAVSPWRDQVAAAGLKATAAAIKAHGLELSGYCRGGMFTYTDATRRPAVFVTSTPIIGKTPVENLLLATGHGTLGWTMAAGTGRVIADIVSGKPPDIDIAGLAMARDG